MSKSLFDQLVSGAVAEELANMDTSYPILEPGEKGFAIKSASKLETDSGEGLLVELSLLDEAVDTNGSPVGANFSVRHLMWMTPVGKLTKESILRNLAIFQDCFGISRTEWDETFESWIGLEGTAVTGIQPAGVDKKGVEREAQTIIKRFVPLKG